MVFTFHHRDREAWEALAKALWQTGFAVSNVFPVRSEGKSGFHSTSGTIKWDSVMVCRLRKDNGAYTNLLRSFQRSVKARQNKWALRLRKAALDFEWPDALSLGYAFAAQQAVSRASSLAEIDRLLDSAKSFLIKDLTPEQRKLLARR